MALEIHRSRRERLRRCPQHHLDCHRLRVTEVDGAPCVTEALTTRMHGRWLFNTLMPNLLILSITELKTSIGANDAPCAPGWVFQTQHSDNPCDFIVVSWPAASLLGALHKLLQINSFPFFHQRCVLNMRLHLLLEIWTGTPVHVCRYRAWIDSVDRCSFR